MRYRMSPTRIIPILLAATCVLGLLACAPDKPADPVIEPAGLESVDASSALAGEWIPATESTESPLTLLVLRADGVVKQTIVGPNGTFINTGTWSPVDSDTVSFQLHTLGFGVPSAIYRFERDDDELTLTFVSGDAWVAGENAPTLVLGLRTTQ